MRMMLAASTQSLDQIHPEELEKYLDFSELVLAILPNSIYE